tara:strand:- start:1694 stop:1936 length:243 start_codon:yes stop_codon:yes gene_type:complete
MLDYLILRKELDIHKNLLSKIDVTNQVCQQRVFQITSIILIVESILEVFGLLESYVSYALAEKNFLTVEVIFGFDLLKLV